MRVKLQEEAKKHQGDSIGVYTLQPELVNGYPTWKQLSLRNSIWIDTSNGKWSIGFTSNLGSNTGGIAGPDIEDDWPQNLSGWKYADGTNWIDAGSNVVIEDYSKCKYENNSNSKLFENSFNINFILVIHIGVTCKLCGTKSIKGSLYTCMVCSDIMACENCEKSGNHQHTLVETISKLRNNCNPESQFSLFK